MALNLTDYHRYRRYFVNLKSLYQKKEVVLYTSLTLSLLTIAFLGLFALKPTFLTIASLFKEIQDKKEINQKLQAKITNLHQAQTNWASVANSIPVVNQALPLQSLPEEIAYQIEALGQRNNLTLRSLSFESVNLQGEKPEPKTSSPNLKEISFNLALNGEFPNLKDFLTSLENLRRVIIIDSFSLSKTSGEEVPKMILTLSARAFYYQPEEQK